MRRSVEDVVDQWIDQMAEHLETSLERAIGLFAALDPVDFALRTSPAEDWSPPRFSAEEVRPIVDRALEGLELNTPSESLRALERTAVKVYEVGGQLVIDGLFGPGEVAFALSDGVIKRQIAAGVQTVTEASVTFLETSRAELAQILSDGRSSGKYPLHIARDMVREMQGAGRERPELIARTESKKALDQAIRQSLERSGVARIEWLTAQDGLVREEHAAMSGATADLPNGTFPNGDSYPGEQDPYNCRCTSLPVVDDDDVDLLPWDGSPQ